MSMEIDDYQADAQSTAVYPPEYSGPIGLFYTTLGLAGEAGEFAGKVKKVLRDFDGVVTDTMRQSLAAELGDVLWYVALTATELGFDLSDIADHNLSKLADRAARGVIRGDGDAR